jgi:Ca2+-binding EF-hand superfamily protein
LDAGAVLFDELDLDGDGFLDRADFKRLLGYIGLSLNAQEFYSTWIGLDRDRSGEVSLEEFFAWYKAETRDPVTMNIHRAIRMTRLIHAAKGAMVYAVDKGSSNGKRSLRSLFDCVDPLGTGFVGHKELMQLVNDLHVDADAYDVLLALREMDPSGDGKVDFAEWAQWWCGTPSPTQSGILRSKLKLSAFTSKASGPILSVVAAADEGAGAAE